MFSTHDKKYTKLFLDSKTKFRPFIILNQLFHIILHEDNNHCS